MEESSEAEFPEIKPIQNLEELLTWKKHKCYTISKETLRRRSFEKSIPKLLLCHDMMGGYLDDRLIQNSKNSDAYRFFFWSKVDLFVYFSHHFVTIPPCGWISTGHRHGVKILGTIITEWDQGQEICSGLLNSISSIVEACAQLCEIAKHYGFDGWLVNIENEIESSQVSMLKYFVSHLTSEMRKVNSESEIIWYDSVTKNGELKWQDELNDLNCDYFNLCNGIFLNYNWTQEKLENSVCLSGNRKQDVFVGVDVFGRGDVQLEGFECQKVIERTKACEMSIAIFAHGWVYETLGKENFIQNECRFWNSLDNVLISKAYSHSALSSSFCQGFGENMYRYGKIVGNSPWHCLSLQQIQPIYNKRVEFCNLDSFMGGGCIKLKYDQSEEDFNIFLTDLNPKSNYFVSYTFKKSEHFDLALILNLKNGTKLILGSKKNIPNYSYNEIALPLNITCSKYNNWETRTFKVNRTLIESSAITEVNIRIFSREKIGILIGEIQIIPEEESKFFLIECNPIKYETELKGENLCQLKWEKPDNINTIIYDIYSNDSEKDEKYLGSTTEIFYYVKKSLKVSNYKVLPVQCI